MTTGSPEPHRVDVDAWLLDVARALDHVQKAQLHAFGFPRHQHRMEAHAERLASDPDYAAAVDRLRVAAESWTGEVSDYVDSHAADLARIDPALGIHPVGSIWSLRFWIDRLTGARERIASANEAVKTLMALTGAQDEATAIDIAKSKRPVLAWSDLDDEIAGVSPAEDQASTPSMGGTDRIEHLVRALEESRGVLGQTWLSRHQRPVDPRTAERLARSTYEPRKGRLGRPARLGREQEVRDALAALGFPPASNTYELGHQAALAVLARPENLNAYLSYVRRTADELRALTGADTVEQAVRSARQTLRANAPYHDEPRRGVVVYRGGLPTLGKRR